MMTTLTDLAGVLARWTLALALVAVTTWCACASALNGAPVVMTAWLVAGVPCACAALWHAHKHTLHVLRAYRGRWVQPEPVPFDVALFEPRVERSIDDLAQRIGVLRQPRHAVDTPTTMLHAVQR